MVDVDKVFSRREHFASVDRRLHVCIMTDQVCACGSRFAGEVPGIELREGGVDVVGIEQNACHDPGFRR